jgi:thiol-disulfide isomerase/thioredoxin
METLDHKAVLRRRHFLTALMVLAALTVMPVWAQVGLDVGQKAPDFSAAGLDGKTQRLSTVTAASRATVVYFWATWCPPCIGEFM